MLTADEVVAGRVVAQQFRLDAWTSLSRAVRAAIEERAALLAAHRGLAFAGVLTD